MELELTAFEPPNSYIVECQTMGINYHTLYKFEREAGGTKVTMVTTSRAVNLKGKILGPLFGGLFKSQMSKSMTQDHLDLKAVCEARAAKSDDA